MSQVLDFYTQAREYNPFEKRERKIGQITDSAGNSFLFDIPQDDIVTYESETTDHVVEDLSHVSDQIINKPVIYTLKGLLGDNLYEAPEITNNQFIERVQGSLGAIEGYLPQYTAGVSQYIQQARNAVNSAINTVDKAIEQGQDIIALGKQIVGDESADEITRKRVAIAKIRKMWRGKELVTLTTEEGDIDNLAIMSLSVTTVAESNDALDIEIKLKQISTTLLNKFTLADAAKKSKVAQDQTAALAQKGKAQGTQTDASVMFKQLGL